MKARYFDRIRGVYVGDADVVKETDRYIIELFTGQLDDLGEEIFVGDILHLSYLHMGLNGIERLEDSVLVASHEDPILTFMRQSPEIVRIERSCSVNILSDKSREHHMRKAGLIK